MFAGNKVEKLCDLCNITVNKNAVFGDSSALAPGGVRIGMINIFCGYLFTCVMQFSFRMHVDLR